MKIRSVDINSQGQVRTMFLNHTYREDHNGPLLGRIINITSVAGVLGGYGQTSYGAAKAGLISLAKSAALEGARFNITANCVLVGIATTDAYLKLPQAVRQQVEKKTAIGRPADPQEIADAVTFLASVEAKYMTGAVMNMLGGLDLFVF